MRSCALGFLVGTIFYTCDKICSFILHGSKAFDGPLVYASVRPVILLDRLDCSLIQLRRICAILARVIVIWTFYAECGGICTINGGVVSLHESYSFTTL